MLISGEGKWRDSQFSLLETKKEGRTNAARTEEGTTKDSMSARVKREEERGD